MDIFQAIVFGIVQGVTEFLPVSSTAHLILLPWFMGWNDPGLSFDVALHLGTLVALLIYFRKEWIAFASSGVDLLRGRTADPNARMFLYIIAATIPGAVVGLLFEKKIETTLRSPLLIAMAFIVMALVLWMAEKKGRRQTDLAHISFSDALVIGFAQALAPIPGVSRSGVTITAGLFRGLQREAAARFSFFLSAPIIAGAVGKKLVDIAREGVPAGQMPAFVVGTIVSGIVGYASIALLLRYLSTHTTFAFIYYRIALGILVLLVLFSGFR